MVAAVTLPRPLPRQGVPGAPAGRLLQGGRDRGECQAALQAGPGRPVHLLLGRWARVGQGSPNLYKEPRNQKFLAPLFFSCESSGESVSLSFCLALAAFSDPGAGRGGRVASVGFIMFCFMSLKEIS